MWHNLLTLSPHELGHVSLPRSGLKLGLIHTVKVVVAHHVVFGIACHVDRLWTQSAGTFKKGFATTMQKIRWPKESCMALYCTPNFHALYQPLWSHVRRINSLQNFALIVWQSYLALVFPKCRRHQLKRQMCLDDSWRIHVLHKINTFNIRSGNKIWAYKEKLIN